jgi:hypothetical protein
MVWANVHHTIAAVMQAYFHRPEADFANVGRRGHG